MINAALSIDGVCTFSRMSCNNACRAPAVRHPAVRGNFVLAVNPSGSTYSTIASR